ncbi:MAG TPA: phospholipase D-like domain-containing protein [Polyangiales bacterium]|nr:phospholipase D-like domain-containing protein [Polyangiales bacterium]
MPDELASIWVPYDVDVWIIPHVFSVLGFLLAVFLLSRILREHRPPASTMAWLLAIVLVPYVGVPLYFLIGGRKHRRLAARKAPLYPRTRSAGVGSEAQHAVERVLVTSGATRPTSGNGLALLPDGEAAYKYITELFEHAERSIDVSTFILGNDDTGSAVLEILTRKAGEGVRVRLLLDGLFAFRTSRRALHRFTRAGGKLAVFMPLLRLPFRGPANLRNHRKIIVVDGKCGVLGGMNLASEYMGPTPLPGRWRDLSLALSGPAVVHLHAVFRSDWEFAASSADSGNADALEFSPEPRGTARLQVVASGPDVLLDTYYDAMLAALFQARQRIWIATPYFIPDESITRALLLAIRRGVDVRLVVPARSNHLTADIAGGSYLRQIEQIGGKVCPYLPSMMHGKMTLIDGDIGVIGSANLDMRSLFLDYEIAVFVYSPDEIDQLSQWFQSLLVDCASELPRPGRTRALAEDLGRLLAPLM